MITRYIILTILLFNIFSCSEDGHVNLAMVNGEAIGMKSFMPRYTSFLLKTHQKDNLRNRFAFLNSMIDERLILNHAKENGIDNDPYIILKKKNLIKILSF